MKFIRGVRIGLSRGKTVFVAYDPLPHPRADDGEGFAVTLSVDGQAVVHANMSAETIEWLYKAYKIVRKERRRKFRFWFHTAGMLTGIDEALNDAVEDDQ